MAIFILDARTPLSLAVWTLYLVPLFLTVYVRQRSSPFLVACAIIILSIIAIFPAYADVPINNALVNRVFFSMVIAVIAFFIWNYRNTAEDLAASTDELHRNLEELGKREHDLSVKNEEMNVLHEELVVSHDELSENFRERLKAEKALEIANEVLEKRVADRTVQLETALDDVRSGRQQLYNVLETLPVYVCLLDAGYHMPFANRYFRETFGESHGRCCYEFLFDLDKPCETCETYTVMKTKAPHHWYWTGPNGRDYDIYDFPFVDTSGSFLILEMGIDITERNKAVAALQEAHDILETRVQERTNELLRKNEELNAINEELSSSQEELLHSIEELGRSEETLRRNEADLTEALSEREVLLSEIHHRVKNNLTAFISLLSLEGAYMATPEGQALRLDLQNRARSMALVHETLYKTKKYSQVDMDAYLTVLVEQIARTYPSQKPVTTSVSARGVTIDIARATPCGLIVNELMTNSFKHAFPKDSPCGTPGHEPCRLDVEFIGSDGYYSLIVSDNGIGLPPSVDIKSTQSLGLKLVYFLSKHQLQATVVADTTHGTKFTIRFKR